MSNLMIFDECAVGTHFGLSIRARNATQAEIDEAASEQMKRDAERGRAIEILRNKYGNSEIEFYYGIVTIGELRDDSEYIRLGEGETLYEALVSAGLIPDEGKKEE